jgi:hypothetical protein
LRAGAGAAALAALASLWLWAGEGALAAAVGPSAEADAAALEACLAEPAMAGRDLRECGERLLKSCLADAGNAPTAATSCEKRRGDAWNAVARQAYHRIEAKLGDAEKRRLRVSQVQFERELSDLCAATRGLSGGDPERAELACASEAVAARAIVLRSLAARAASTP